MIEIDRSKQRTRNFVALYGRNKTVALLTVLSTVLSLAITWALPQLFGQPPPTYMVPWITATVAPLAIAPLMSSYLIGLLVEINLLEIEMRTLATYDTLTGIHNRGSFMAGAELL